MPLYPSIVLRAKERAPTPCPSVVFSLGLTFESLKELGVRPNPNPELQHALLSLKFYDLRTVP
jgi:hypothetical protein